MKNKKFFIENWVKIAITVVIVVLAYCILNQIQNDISTSNQHKESVRNLEAISSTWADNESTAAELTSTFHKGNIQILNDLKQLMQNSEAATSLDSSGTTSSATKKISIGSVSLDGLLNQNFAPYVLIVNGEGLIGASVDSTQVGKNIVSSGFITENEFKQLMTYPSEGVNIVPSGDNNNYYFYAVSLEPTNPKQNLVVGFNDDSFQERLDSLNSIGNIVDDASLSSGTAVFEIDSQEGTIVYCSDDSFNLVGKTIDEAKIPDSLLENSGSGTLTINGKDFICASVVHTCDYANHSNNSILVQAVSTQVRFGDNYKPTLLAILLLVMTLIVAVHYGLLLPRDLTKNKRKQKIVYFCKSKLALNVTAAVKTLPLLALGAVLIFGSVFYCRTVMKLSWAMDDVDRPLTELVSQLETNEEQKKSVEEYCDQMSLSKAQMVATMIEADPSCLNEPTDKVYTEYTQSGERKVINDSLGNPLRSIPNSKYLQDVCSKNSLSKVQLFNDLGYVIATSDDNWYYKLSHDSNSQSSQFYDVITGKLDYLVQAEKKDDEGNMNQYTGVSFHYYRTKDDKGNSVFVSKQDYQNYVNGSWTGNPITQHQAMLQIATDTTVRENLLQSMELSYIMEHISLSNNAHMVVFDNSSDHKVLYTPYEQDMGKTAKELGITDDEFSGDYNGFQTVTGVEYYECCRYISGYYVAVATPTSTLYSSRVSNSARVTIACIIVMIIAMLMFLITSKKDMEWLQDANKFKVAKTQESDEEDDNELDGFSSANIDHNKSSHTLTRWKQGFYEASAKDTITYMIRILALVLGVYCVIGFFSGSLLFADSSVINYVFTGNWAHGVNVFAFTKGIVILVVVIVLVELLTGFVRIVSSVFSANAATIANFLMSFARYVCVIAAIFYALYLFGMDSMSLLASAGIMSIVIGLGAKSLISDMLASVFIIFEGYYHVGDNVVIDKTIGVVEEIGIRSTKVRKRDNTIQIYGNSTIKEMVNMQVKEARVRLDFFISYDESLERVEEILKKEFATLPDKIPQLIAPPKCMGVRVEGPTSIGLLIISRCKGSDYMKVRRAMYSEFQLIREKYNINSSDNYHVDFPEGSRDQGIAVDIE